MNVKRIVTAALLAFVAASIVFMVAQGERGGEAGSAALVPAGGAGEPAYVVAYFHGNKRCNTCLTIEKYARNTVEEAFADELTSGRVAWRVLNYEEPENASFARDHEIAFQTLVVFEMDGTEPGRWKKLDKVWDEVGSEFSFYEYVQSEIRAFMNEG